MKEWKDEFHAAPEQEDQQKRDSWKPTGPPPDAHDKWGTNTKAVRSGKHSRFPEQEDQHSILFYTILYYRNSYPTAGGSGGAAMPAGHEG